MNELLQIASSPKQTRYTLKMYAKSIIIKMDMFAKNIFWNSNSTQLGQRIRNHEKYVYNGLETK